MAGDDLSVANDPEIYNRMTRVEEIIEQLDTDKCGVKDSIRLYLVGQELSAEVKKSSTREAGASWNSIAEFLLVSQQ